MGNAQNLIPNEARTPEERRENARKAGKASGAARREKKLMSEIYAEYLAKEHDITTSGAKSKISGEKLFSQVMTKILARGDSASVSLMKEIREATEGNKTTIEGQVIVYMDRQDEKL